MLSKCNYFFLQEVRLKGMKICVKDLLGSGSSHDPLTVSYAVIGGWFFHLSYLDIFLYLIKYF